MTEQALAGMRVIEYGEFVCAPYCAKLLADFGAEVILAKKPLLSTVRKSSPILRFRNPYISLKRFQRQRETSYQSQDC